MFAKGMRGCSIALYISRLGTEPKNEERDVLLLYVNITGKGLFILLLSSFVFL